jgi:hypothetical protein
MTEEKRKQARARWNEWHKRTHPKTAHTCANCDQPFEGKSNQKYCSHSCSNIGWKRRSGKTQPKKQWLSLWKTEEWKEEPAEQIELIPSAKVKKSSNCGDYRHCMTCRNAERNRRAKANDNALKLAMDAMSPEVLAICLEVRALNSRKHQPAMTAAMTPAPATGD